MRNQFILHIGYIIFFIFVLNLSVFAQPNWTWINTGVNHTILFQSCSATINGVPIDAGDYIGVFFEDTTGGLHCCGYYEWTNNTIVITAWGDDLSSPQKDGLSPGEAFKWKIWDSSMNIEVNAFASYSSIMPQEGNYFTNGMSSVYSLVSSNFIMPTVTNTSCAGLTDGSINITVVYGTPPYTYNWSNGASTEDIANLAPGSYTVTVTDVNNISHSTSATVNDALSLGLNILINESNAFMCQAHAQAFPFGGTSPYTYIWSDPLGQTTAMASELCEGYYSVSVTDANNCQTDTSIVIIANSGIPTDSAFTLLDTCFLYNTPDTAYISNLYYTATTMEIEWTIVENSIFHILNTSYPTITTPGIYYVSLVINCTSKGYDKIEIVSIIEIGSDVFETEEIANEIFSCKIAPNPVSKELRIFITNSNSVKYNVIIYNSVGNLVFESDYELSGQNYLNISVDKLPHGLYITKISNKLNQISVISFVK